LRRGEIYRSGERLPERGHKPGFYIVVSRDFIAANDDVSTVVCAPVYGAFLGLRTEVALGPDDELPRDSSVRCDFLTLLFKRKLTQRVGTLSADRIRELNRALGYALQVGDETSGQTTRSR
jgi:mRNA-degrading endonuclease toxin of MazEF toxin-antitoxin module